MKKREARYKPCEICKAEDGMPCVSMTTFKGRLRRRSPISKVHAGRQKWTEQDWVDATELAVRRHNQKIQEIKDLLDGYY